MIGRLGPTPDSLVTEVASDDGCLLQHHDTLLNHCGIWSDLLPYTVDRSPVKQGKFLPGTHIRIYPPDRLAETRPDYILVLPWNLREEISSQLGYGGVLGRKLVFPIPELEVISVGV